MMSHDDVHYSDTWQHMTKKHDVDEEVTHDVKHDNAQHDDKRQWMSTAMTSKCSRKLLLWTLICQLTYFAYLRF